MPYQKRTDLPSTVLESLPSHGEKIYQKAFNSAWRQYKNKSDRQSGRSQEETAHAVAWSAVKTKYTKNKETGKWEKK